jgi:predicted porin
MDPAYDFGVVRPMVQYVNDELGTQHGTGWLVGATAVVGASNIRVSYSTYKLRSPAGNPASNKLALGYSYNLSKRSAIYSTVASMRNSGGATQALGTSTVRPNGTSRGIDIGVRHIF